MDARRHYSPSEPAPPDFPPTSPIHAVGWLTAAGDSIELERPLGLFSGQESVRGRARSGPSIRASSSPLLNEQAFSVPPLRIHNERYYFEDGNVIFEVFSFFSCGQCQLGIEVVTLSLT